MGIILIAGFRAQPAPPRTPIFDQRFRQHDQRGVLVSATTVNPDGRRLKYRDVMSTDAIVALTALRDAAADGTLEPVMNRLGVRLLGVFGSATEAGSAPQDLDIAVQFEGAPKVLELIDALVELTNYDRIDIAVVEGDHPVLDAEALSGEPLYEQTPGAFANAQMAALGHRRDTEWLRALDLRRMAG